MRRIVAEPSLLAGSDTNRSGSQLRFSALSSYPPVDSLAR
jgi:hypothetical protein